MFYRSHEARRRLSKIYLLISFEWLKVVCQNSDSLHCNLLDESFDSVPKYPHHASVCFHNELVSHVSSYARKLSHVTALGDTTYLAQIE